MRTRVILDEYPWEVQWSSKKDFPPHIKKYVKCFLDLFAKYKPQPSSDKTGSYDFPVYEFTSPADDPEVQKLLGELHSILKKAKKPGGAYFCQMPTNDELDRARFLEPYYLGSYVTDGPRGELNTKLRACDECKSPNLSFRPAPLLVNKSVLKQYDVFHTDKSFLVVRKWILDLLKESVGGQIEFGDVAIVKSKENPTGDARLFWVRPKATIGARIIVENGQQQCDACKRKSVEWIGGIDNVVNKLGPGLADYRLRVEHYGKAGLEIALVDESKTGDWPRIVMSGALLALLKSRGAKGIVALTKDLWPQCIFSQKGEPTLKTQARGLGKAGVAPNSKKKTECDKAAKQAAALKDLPWDYTADGYVYFHLSTSKFMALDPMTMEDSGSPYEVANFKGPGVYRFPVSAIKNADEEGIAVDSATLLFMDNEFLSELMDQYEWEKATKRGKLDWTYHQQVAEKVGTRFGICTTPPKKFKSAFKGDGFYKIDAKQVKLVSRKN